MEGANGELNEIIEFARMVAKFVEEHTPEGDAPDYSGLSPEDAEEARREVAEEYDIDYNALFEDAEELEVGFGDSWVESAAEYKDMGDIEKRRKIVLLGAFVYGRRTVNFRIVDEGSTSKVNTLLFRTNLLDGDDKPAFREVLKHDAA